MQIHNNCRHQHPSSENGCLPSCTPLAPHLEQKERVARYLMGEDGRIRCVFLTTLTRLALLMRRVDPLAQLCGRIKSIPSISAKMSRTGYGVRQIPDIIGIRAIMSSIGDCYLLIGRIHRALEVSVQEYDDYIAVPKPNGYRSIHSTVVSPCGLPVEIQIRTQWMQTLTEHGPAAHEEYKKDRVLWIPMPVVPSMERPLILGGIT